MSVKRNFGQNLPIYFYFVSKNDPMSYEMQKTYNYLNKRNKVLSKGLANLTEDEFLISTTIPNILSLICVFESFDGDAFQQAKEWNKLVISPRLLRHAIRNNLNIPISNYALDSLVMSRTSIVFYRITPHEAKRIKQTVRRMGGEVVYSLTEKTTHILTDQLTDELIEISTKSKALLMHTNWINHVWSLSQQNITVCPYDSIFNHYAMPKEKFMADKTVCVYGFSTTICEQFENRCKMAGAEIKNNLPGNKVNYLIAPIDRSNLIINIEAEECFNDKWLNDSILKNRFTRPKYYHLSVSVENCVQ